MRTTFRDKWGSPHWGSLGLGWWMNWGGGVSPRVNPSWNDAQRQTRSTISPREHLYSRDWALSSAQWGGCCCSPEHQGGAYQNYLFFFLHSWRNRLFKSIFKENILVDKNAKKQIKQTGDEGGVGELFSDLRPDDYSMNGTLVSWRWGGFIVFIFICIIY